MKLFNNFLALERIRENPTGLIIPQEVRDEKPKMGKVVALADGVEGVSEGDLILFLEYAPFLAEIGGKEIIFVKKEDIIAKI